MKKRFLEGIYFGLGFLLILGLVGVVSAIGFHTANEILPGTFDGSYNFINGKVSIGSIAPDAQLEVVNAVNTSTNWWTNQQATLILRNGHLSGDSAILKFEDTTGRIIFGNALTTDKLLIASRHSAGIESANVAINNVGNVGIGTISPSQKLHIYDSTNARVLIENAGGEARLLLKGNTATHEIQGMATGDFAIKASNGNTRFFSNATQENMRISSSGNVGINTVTPGSTLQIGDENDGNFDYVQIDSAGTGIPPAGDCDSTSEYGRIFYDLAADRLYVCDGSGWMYTQLS